MTPEEAMRELDRWHEMTPEEQERWLKMALQFSSLYFAGLLEGRRSDDLDAWLPVYREVVARARATPGEIGEFARRWWSG
ncbi:hypothetical protein KQ693_05805 [Thermus sp. PS18]|uniref:hypothetical protein n=1 Tax=Thermus sp. PS18 TaxID=2849039 RepID=UPI002264A14F|nr:hypothetical protein [Thermus sp. PS18]UZX16543.1 hypothetical protein KQ693_05805 [Thermus sp. PS18]